MARKPQTQQPSETDAPVNSEPEVPAIDVIDPGDDTVDTGPNRPEVTFRIGHVFASVWLNCSAGDFGPRYWRTITLQRRFAPKDGGAAEYKTSFTLADAPLALKALQMASDYVANREAVVRRSGPTGHEPAGVGAGEQ